MAKAPFTLFKRTNKAGKTSYSARFLDADGRIVRTVALGTGHKTTAARKAAAMLASGVVAEADNPFVLDFIDSTWRMDSAYVKGRALRGMIISERYIDDSRRIAHRIFGKALKGLRMGDLTPGKLEAAILEAAEAGYGPRTVNLAIQSIRVPYNWYCREHRLANALAGVRKLAEHPKERGTLSAAEVARIVAIEDESPRAKAAVLLAALCGLRLGEVRGLQWEDIDEERGLIEVRHNAPTNCDTVKAPKWGSVRTVPAPQAVLDALALCKAMPEAKGSSFVIYNQAKKDKPVEEVTIMRGLHRILERLALGEKYATATKKEKFEALAAFKARNITLHALRHTFVSLTRAAGVPDFAVMRLAGHKTASMMENYSHAGQVIDFAAARGSIDAILQAAGTPKAGGKAKKPASGA